MTKFEQVGINIQYQATTKEEAIQNFSRSCECCCNKELHINCDRCAIETVHKLIIAGFETKCKGENNNAIMENRNNNNVK